MVRQAIASARGSGSGRKKDANMKVYPENSFRINIRFLRSPNPEYKVLGTFTLRRPNLHLTRNKQVNAKDLELPICWLGRGERAKKDANMKVYPDNYLRINARLLRSLCPGPKIMGAFTLRHPSHEH